MPPQEVMAFLNRHLTIAADAVTQQAGVIDKYMANEIMGLFNTQLNPAEEHAWHAVLAAMTMMDEFAQFYRALGEPLRCAILPDGNSHRRGDARQCRRRTAARVHGPG